MHALIIEDSRAMRRLIGRIMTSLGFELLEAANGREGLQQLNDHHKKIEVVLVDWNMPEMNGLEFVRSARAEEKHGEQKIIMVTTETAPTQMARALLAGVDEFVMKPFTRQILIDKLKLIGVRMPVSQ